MARINLSGGTYQAQSAAVAAQRCLNLYPEPVPQDEGEPIRFAYYPTPGLRRFVTLSGVIRCLYQTTQGDLIAVAGPNVYHVMADGRSNLLGSILNKPGQVRMSDNGLVLFIVDQVGGWYCTLPTTAEPDYGELTGIDDEAYYGSRTIDVLDQFFLFTQPDSRHWYTSPSDFTDEATTPFDSLYIASKTSSPDTIIALSVLGQTIWLFGRNSTEFWYNSGAADFPFARVPGVTAEVGCISPYSVAKSPDSGDAVNGKIFWLGRDRGGYARIYMGQQQLAVPISTFAVDLALQSYGDLSNAIGSCYQQRGHQFYVLTLPDAGKTWVYDATVGMWHERCGLDSEGNETRIRANCWASAYGNVYCGDFENGMIYQATLDVQTDNGVPVKRQRAFPHLLTDGTRGIHRQFMLDMQNGATQTINVDWSDDRGATFCPPMPIDLGTNGNVWPTIWRLGLARDRVYRVTWTDPGATALMGAFIDLDPVRT